MFSSMGRACGCHCQCQCGRRYQIHVDGFHHTRHRISQAPLKHCIGRICGLRMWLPSAGETLADLRRSLPQTMCSPLLRERVCISSRRATLRQPVSQQTLHRLVELNHSMEFREVSEEPIACQDDSKFESTSPVHPEFDTSLG